MISFDDFTQMDLRTGTILKQKNGQNQKAFGVENRLG